MKSIIKISPDGSKKEYRKISDCAREMGVSVQGISEACRIGTRIKGCTFESAQIERIRESKFIRHSKQEKKVKKFIRHIKQAKKVKKLICKWYTAQNKFYISSDALIELFNYLEGKL